MQSHNLCQSVLQTNTSYILKSPALWNTNKISEKSRILFSPKSVGNAGQNWWMPAYPGLGNECAIPTGFSTWRTDTLSNHVPQWFCIQGLHQMNQCRRKQGQARAAWKSWMTSTLCCSCVKLFVKCKTLILPLWKERARFATALLTMS